MCVCACVHACIDVCGCPSLSLSVCPSVHLPCLSVCPVRLSVCPTLGQVHSCMLVCVRALVSAHTHVYIHECSSVLVCVSAHLCVHGSGRQVCVCSSDCPPSRLSACLLCSCMHLHVHAHMCVCVCMCMCMHVCVCMHGSALPCPTPPHPTSHHTVPHCHTHPSARFASMHAHTCMHACA